MSNTFCPMPFTHENIKQEGKVSACWRYPDRIGDYRNNSLEEIWNNEPIKQLRSDLLNGEKPDGCRSCWDLEASGSTSTRQQCQQTWDFVTEEHVRKHVNDDYSYPLHQLRSVEIRFDNICNLMCRHCSPDYSSKWEVAVKKDNALMEKMVEYGTYRKDAKHVKLNQEMIDEISLKLAPNLKEIMIAGGEPLYHDKHYQFLENLQPYAKNIRLSYNTNLNTLEYKGKSILDLWKNFKKLWIRVSIDGEPGTYEYVRAAGNLDKVEENIKILNNTLPNADISATCTVNLYNITRLVDVLEYYTSLDVYFHTSLVQYPKALNIKLLPKHLKEKVTQDVNNWFIDARDKIDLRSSKVDPQKQLQRITKFTQNVLNYMNSEDLSNEWHLFEDYTKALDNYHNTNYLDVYPEFLLNHLS
jgi:radical SAM protein with 4Fe4S-binding SPASM domain